MKNLFANRGFITLMLAQLVSSLGDWLSLVAIITLVGLKWEASSIEVSFIILSLVVPMALLGPFTGALADRLKRSRLMIFSDLARAGFILLLTLAESIWLVYICLFLIGTFSAIFIPAKNGKLKELVIDGEMKRAMSITSMIDSITKVIGPLLSGILVTAFGSKLVFFIDSGTFFLSALLIMTLPKTLEVKKNSIEELKQSSFKEDMVEGIRFVKKSRFFMVGLFVLGISLLILQLSDSQVIVLLRELTSASPDLFGIVVAFSGTGMFISGIYMTKKTDYHAISVMLAGVLGIGVCFSVMAIMTKADLGFSTYWASGLALIGGFSAGMVFIPFQATVQTDTPVQMTGRVFGVINSVTTTATIIGPLLGGVIATFIGVIPTFIITGSLLILTAIIVYMFRKKIERGNLDVTKDEQGAYGAASN